MLRRILVGLADVAHTQAASRIAVSLAKSHQAQLTAVTLVDPSQMEVGSFPVGAGDAARELHEHRVQLTEEILKAAEREFRSACDSAGVGYDVLHEEGNVFARAADLTRYHDLVITGLRNLVTHGVLPSCEDELVRLVEGRVRPLLAVTPTVGNIERVLISYSGSSTSAEAMKRYAQLNLWPAATVRVVHFARQESASTELLEQARAYAEAHELNVETDWAPEPPHDGLLAYADGWNADVIVMGNCDRSYFVRKLFGETVMHVVAHTDRPLFLA